MGGGIDGMPAANIPGTTIPDRSQPEDAPRRLLDDGADHYADPNMITRFSVPNEHIDPQGQPCADWDYPGIVNPPSSSCAGHVVLRRPRR